MIGFYQFVGMGVKFQRLKRMMRLYYPSKSFIFEPMNSLSSLKVYEKTVKQIAKAKFAVKKLDIRNQQLLQTVIL